MGLRVVTFKADEELLRQLDEIARESKVPRSVVIRKLLARGIASYNLMKSGRQGQPARSARITVY
jgi:Ribbon-helix-helix protein, copG family.